MSNKEPEVLHDFYGSKAFVKIKQCLEIDKMCFSFVNSQEGKTKEHIDCYMKAEEFGLLAIDIKNGTLIRKLEEEKRKGAQYPNPVWTSPMGGTTINGNAVSRYFDIAPASIQGYDVVFTAKVFPAETNSTGAYIPVKGAKATLILRIPGTITDLRMIQYKWSWLEKDYMSKKYNLDSMKAKNTNQQTKPNASPVASSSYDSGSNNSKKQPIGNDSSTDSLNENFVELRSLTPVVGYGKRGYKCLKAITKNNREMILVIPPEKVQSLTKECNSLKPGVMFRVMLQQYNEKYIVQSMKL